MFFSDYHFIGAGGIGSWLIPAATRLLAYNVPDCLNLTWPLIYDGDTYESRNIDRQLCGKAQMGMNKADAMVLQLRHQGLDGVSIAQYVDKPLLRTQLKLSDTPLIISCVDNDATRKLIIDVMEERDGDFFHLTCGNSDGTESIRASCHWHGRHLGKQIGLNPALIYSNIENPTDHAPVHGTCAAEAPSRPQLIAANFAAANLAISVLTNLLQSELDPTHNSAFTNGRSFKSSIS